MSLWSSVSSTFQNPAVQTGLLGAAVAGGTVASGGTLPLAAGLGLGAASIYQNYLNYQQQEQNYEYQQDLQQQMMNREDESIQRRVADLKAAGLSPVLAAGQGASAGSVINTKAPQMDDSSASVMAALKMTQDIQNTQAQRELIKAQTKQAELTANRTNIENAIANKDWLRYKTTGVNPRNASMPGKLASDIITGGSHAVEQISNKVKSTWNNYDNEMMKLQNKVESFFKGNSNPKSTQNNNYRPRGQRRKK